MLYCIKYSIKFELYSDYTHIALRDGWDDFFIPFDNKNHQRINNNYNLRSYIIEQSREAPLQKLVKYKYITTVYKALYGITYLTQDLWAHHRNPAFAAETFTIPELGLIDAPMLEATQQLIKAFWRYNLQSAPLINAFIEVARLPVDEYVSIHIRAGDKSNETKVFNFSEYMAKANHFSLNHKAFVLTDDYTVIEQLRIQYPGWTFYTLCEPTERGYVQQEFIKESREHKYRHHLRLFAEMDIAAASTKFIGTYTSNMGMFMGMRQGEQHCACIDYDQWILW